MYLYIYIYIYIYIVHPEIVTEVIDFVTNETYPATFTCQASGEPAPNISWYFNGVVMDVSDTSKYRIEPRPINTTTTENTLTVYNVTSSDVGTYTCNATNTIGSDVSGDVQTDGILTVNGNIIYTIFVNHYIKHILFTVAPNITSPSEGQIHYTEEGQTTTLSCTSTGYPAPVVVWQRNGDNLTTSNSTVVSTNVGNVTEVTVNLTITDVTRDCTDNYTCSSSNLLNTTIRSVSLIVQCK